MTPNTGFFSESQEVDGPPSFMDSSIHPCSVPGVHDSSTKMSSLSQGKQGGE